MMCHGADLSGGQQVPRIAQQREDYLQMTLREFKSGKRPGYTQAMGEAVEPHPDRGPGHPRLLRGALSRRRNTAPGK